MNGAATSANLYQRPVTIGLIWAVLTLALIFATGWYNGEPMPVQRLAVMVPAFAVGGLGWGYIMSWFLGKLIPDARRSR